MAWDDGQHNQTLLNAGRTMLSMAGRGAWRLGRAAGRALLKRALGTGVKALLGKVAPYALGVALAVLILLFVASLVYTVLTDMAETHAFAGSLGDEVANTLIQQTYQDATHRVTDAQLAAVSRLECAGPWATQLEALLTPWELLAAVDMARDLDLARRSGAAIEAMARQFPFEVTCGSVELETTTTVYRDGQITATDTTTRSEPVIKQVRNWQGDHAFQYVTRTERSERTWTEEERDPETGEVVAVYHYREVTEREVVDLGGIASLPTYEPVRAVLAAPPEGEPRLSESDVGWVVYLLNRLASQGDEIVYPDPVGEMGWSGLTPGAILDLPVSASGLTWPVASTRISSEFGPRLHPITGRYKIHTGIDVPVPIGTPVAAAQAGTVVRVVHGTTGYGNYVLIDHGGGLQTRYAHLAQPLVTPGQTVQAGQVIGLSGNSGWSTGPHLHFETIVHGAPVNPRLFFPDLR
ncbi:M23 family metallopeptidase [Thermaerobacter litoralis]